MPNYEAINPPEQGVRCCQFSQGFPLAWDTSPHRGTVCSFNNCSALIKGRGMQTASMVSVVSQCLPSFLIPHWHLRDGFIILDVTVTWEEFSGCPWIPQQKYEMKSGSGIFVNLTCLFLLSLPRIKHNQLPFSHSLWVETLEPSSLWHWPT